MCWGDGASMCMCGQGTIVGVGSFLIPCASEGQNSDPQAWWQVFLPTEPLGIFPSSRFLHFITIEVLCERATNTTHETTVINNLSSFCCCGGTADVVKDPRTSGFSRGSQLLFGGHLEIPCAQNEGGTWEHREISWSP